jgi:hypothetical protein
VQKQRHGDTGHLKRLRGDGVALEGEEHDDGEQQTVEGHGCDAGQESASYQSGPLRRSPITLVTKPAPRGTPRKMSTAQVMSPDGHVQALLGTGSPVVSVGVFVVRVPGTDG